MSYAVRAIRLASQSTGSGANNLHTGTGAGGTVNHITHGHTHVHGHTLPLFERTNSSSSTGSYHSSNPSRTPPRQETFFRTSPSRSNSGNDVRDRDKGFEKGEKDRDSSTNLGNNGNNHNVTPLKAAAILKLTIDANKANVEANSENTAVSLCSSPSPSPRQGSISISTGTGTGTGTGTSPPVPQPNVSHFMPLYLSRGNSFKALSRSDRSDSFRSTTSKDGSMSMPMSMPMGVNSVNGNGGGGEGWDWDPYLIQPL